MDGRGEIFLRVKRRYTESPIECFNTFPAKRKCLDNEPTGVAHFKYLGTSSTTFETANIALEDLRNVGAAGERKIILSTKNIAHILDSSQDSVQCVVRVTSAQCRGLKRKVDVCEDEVPTESLPNKSIRIIDLSVKDQSLAISSALDNLKVNSEDGLRDGSSDDADKLQVMEHDNGEDNDSGFVYDLYAVTSDTENTFDFSPIIYDQDSDEYDRRAFGDDSDSNSESNWRNDYPDEESYTSSLSEIDDNEDSEGDDDDDNRCGFIY
nr:protein SLC7A6OS [Hymenolepis microstoma]